ncbi:pyridoxal-phosphate dependent enzyme [Kibdelosporangium philippinense]|uniref:Pyridoxal-phosphate dependent enzyme n=1 Tax=Kibdelosporangium philippinense TaxID=211113 RepID=A0ABS8ZBV8_9PSEU|nr:pyridoxal-phosphate dependent enzyme [Kibdelosporangium philippinense]MCE7005361.1 pyridoxal-phosphate dependent enzyme [Kibdelosporangium philippinense]
MDKGLGMYRNPSARSWTASTNPQVKGPGQPVSNQDSSKLERPGQLSRNQLGNQTDDPSQLDGDQVGSQVEGLSEGRGTHAIVAAGGPGALSGDPRALHRELPGFEPMPLIEVPELARELRVRRVLVKDEHLRAGLPSFKILGAAWAIFKGLGGTTTLEDLEVDPETTLVSATAGNHGRAVAYMAKLLNLKARIFIPAGTATARIEAIRSEGAQVEVIEGDYQEAVRQAEATANKNPKAFLAADVGDSMTPIWATQGYRTILREIDEQLAEAPDLVVVPVGAGAFASAVVQHYRGDGHRPKILTVEPDTAACLQKSLHAGKPVNVPGPHPSSMAGLNAGDVDAHAWPYLKNGVDAAVTVTDEEANKAMHDLASHNIIAGECGAASLAGARAFKHELTRDSVVVLISTEGVHDSVSR